MHKVLQLEAFWFDMPPRWGLVSKYDEQVFVNSDPVLQSLKDKNKYA